MEYNLDFRLYGICVEALSLENFFDNSSSRKKDEKMNSVNYFEKGANFGFHFLSSILQICSNLTGYFSDGKGKSLQFLTKLLDYVKTPLICVHY